MDRGNERLGLQTVRLKSVKPFIQSLDALPEQSDIANSRFVRDDLGNFGR